MFRPNVYFQPVCLAILRRGYQLKHLLLTVEDDMNCGVVLFGTRQMRFESQWCNSLAGWNSDSSSPLWISFPYLKSGAGEFLPTRAAGRVMWDSLAVSRWHVQKVGSKLHYVYAGLFGGLPNSSNPVFSWQWELFSAADIFSSCIFSSCVH